MRGARDEAGFALLIVLWALVLLSLIMTQLLSAGRSEARLTDSVRQSALAEAVADGAVQEALFHLVAGGAKAWPPRGRHMVRMGRGVADIAIEDLSGKVNPNRAGVKLLRALIGLCGAPPAQATQLARAIMAWRGAPPVNGEVPATAYRAAGLSYSPPELPMQTLDELALVMGMTPPLRACLAPRFSLLQPGQPSTRSDDAMVARAVRLAVQDGEVDAPDNTDPTADVVQVTAVATVMGARFVRRVTARLGPVEDGRPFRIVTWNAGEF